MKTIDIAPEQLQSALAILDRERQRLPLTESRENAYRWLIWISYGCVAIAVVLGLVWGLAALPAAQSVTVWLWYLVLSFVNTTSLIAVSTIIMVALMFALNLPVLLSILRQDIELRRLGFAHTLDLSELKSPPLVRIRAFLGIFIVSWGVFFLLLTLVLPYPSNTGFPDIGPRFPLLNIESVTPDGPVTLWVSLCFLWTLVAGLLYWGLHHLQQARARLRYVSNLRARLQKGQASSVDEGTYQSLAEIERGQIARDRAASIRNFEPGEMPSAIVQKSHAFNRSLQKLTPEIVLAVIDCIDGLSAASNGPGEYTVPVPDTGLEVAFIRDTSANTLRLTELRPVAAQERKRA